MSEPIVRTQVAHRWYARPVRFAADVNRALRFHIDMLGFELTADGLAAFRQELVDRKVPNKTSRWGSDVIQVDDPDGNELLFPFPDWSPRRAR